MTPSLSAPARDDLLAHFARGLSTRTLRHVAEEARLDGESLRQGVERYEIDYAWHVLGSPRLRDACSATLAAHLGREVSPAQQACLVEVLQSAAAAQPADALMSFDNDVPEHLARLLCAWFEQQSVQAPEVV